MTSLGLRSYPIGDCPKPRIVPVAVVLLTCDKAPNIGPCLPSVSSASQVVVVDPQLADQTAVIAEALGSKVVKQRRLSFSRHTFFVSASSADDSVFVSASIIPGMRSA
jgi:hypothetical protein